MGTVRSVFVAASGETVLVAWLVVRNSLATIDCRLPFGEAQTRFRQSVAGFFWGTERIVYRASDEGRAVQALVGEIR